MVLLEKLIAELPVIGHVAVVGHDDAEGRVELEGLGVLAAAAADRGVAGMADADRAAQVLDGLGGEDVVDEAVALFRVEAPVEGDDAGRVLAAVLDGQEALVEVPYHGAVAPDANDAAHGQVLTARPGSTEASSMIMTGISSLIG